MNISHHALAAARSIANYCKTRFPCDMPPHELIDVPWFAEKIQKAIDAALTHPPPPRTLCNCRRCGRAMTTHDAGNYSRDLVGVWRGVCRACLQPDED